MEYAPHNFLITTVALIAITVDLSSQALPGQVTSEDSALTESGREFETLRQSESDNSELAFIEFQDIDTPVYAGQSIHVQLVFGIQSELADGNLQQLFRKPLDVPVQVDSSSLDWEVPFLTGPPFSVEPPKRQVASTTTTVIRSFVFNGELAECNWLGETTRAGTVFQTYAYVSQVHVKRPGRLQFEAPSLRFAYATESRVDLLGRTVPVDRLDAEIRGDSCSITALALPELNRPIEFSGAIGQFQIDSAVSEHVIDATEHFEFTIRMRGNGNLAHFTAPRFEWDGFNLLGSRDTYSQGVRTFQYDLAPKWIGEGAIKDIRFVCFDPAPPGEYRTASLPTYELSVRGDATASHSAKNFTPIAFNSKGQGNATILWATGIGVIALFLIVRRYLRHS